ncbi:hypothetical protein FRB98_004548 [Tulasnella sp. 332]|nr:hypothetical protein FRB98_004548 [Tulasnella sp. 332]
MAALTLSSSDRVVESTKYPTSSAPTSLPLPTYERPLSDNELADGVNDMYLHIGFRASAGLLTERRLGLVWAILRGRHPLLASQVVMECGAYDSARFTYTPPGSANEALNDAMDTVEMRGIQYKDDLISTYLNATRTLSASQLSALFVSSEPTLHADGEEWNVLFCATHFIGDGMALHQTANDFFKLIAGAASSEASGEEIKTHTEEELLAILEAEWIERWGSFKGAEKEAIQQASALEVAGMQPIPASSEMRLPQPRGKMHAAAVKVDFKNSESRLIGGHSFPKAAIKGSRKTVVKTISFDSATTKTALKKCKAEGATISSALFALCNLAWMRTMDAHNLAISNGPSLPMMMYSAINLRPWLASTTTTPTPSSSSYWFLSVGYFNVILPTFSFTSAQASFWYRARSAKAQSSKYVKSPMLVARAQEMAKERGKRAKTWAKQDDDAEALQVAAQMKETGLKITPGQSQMLLTPPPSPGFGPKSASSSTSSAEKANHGGRPRMFSKIAKSARKSLSSLRQTLSSSIGKLPMSPPMSPSPSSKRLSFFSIASVASASASPKSPPSNTPPTPLISTVPPPSTTKTPSAALMGLSLLGNLDGTYAHATYSPNVTLHTLTTGSRQRSGGMLLFGYTFAGKMWISLGWDVNAFGEGVVQCFWAEVEKGVQEMLLAA